MFDAHRHPSRGSTPACNALYATSETGQWPSVLGVQPPAIGGLGWLGDRRLPPIDEVERLLRSYPALQIAEVGLDRRFEDIGLQRTFLLEMLHLAFGYDRSLTIHCVRQDGMLLSLLRQERKHLPILLWHGCTASLETVREATRLGVIPSYGPTFFASRLAKHRQELLKLPFALETDFSGDENTYQAVLEHHCQRFSAWSDLSVEQLEKHNDGIRSILAPRPSIG